MTKSTFILSLFALSLFLVLLLQKPASLNAFEQWKKQFGSVFGPNEEEYRKLIFYKNLDLIQSHNSDFTQTYKLGINSFSIYSQEEFKSKFLSDIIVEAKYQIQEDQKSFKVTAVDWVAKGKVSKVKDQGECASDYAFAATAVAESWSLIKGKQMDLSEQQLVDCTRGTYGNSGCKGGLAQRALQYVWDNGMTTEASYPYVGVTNACKQNGGQFTITRITTTGVGCIGLTNAITISPQIVSLDASNWSQYKSGIFSNCRSSGLYSNHFTLAVGIDANGVWTIKNSWGVGWGQNGFIRLSSGNTCGLCNNGGIYVS